MLYVVSIRGLNVPPRSRPEKQRPGQRRTAPVSPRPPGQFSPRRASQLMVLPYLHPPPPKNEVKRGNAMQPQLPRQCNHPRPATRNSHRCAILHDRFPAGGAVLRRDRQSPIEQACYVSVGVRSVHTPTARRGAAVNGKFRISMQIPTHLTGPVARGAAGAGPARRRPASRSRQVQRPRGRRGR